MGRERSTDGKQERCIQGFGGKVWGNRPLEGPGVDGRIILKWGIKKWDVGLDWICSDAG